jgi:hypothetical protein
VYDAVLKIIASQSNNGELPMIDAQVRSDRTVAKILIASACGLGTAALIAAAMLVATPRGASAKPEFAAQTGLPCGQCHSNPAGGGKLKSFGEKFKANGNKVK